MEKVMRPHYLGGNNSSFPQLVTVVGYLQVNTDGIADPTTLAT